MGRRRSRKRSSRGMFLGVVAEGTTDTEVSLETEIKVDRGEQTARVSHRSLVEPGASSVLIFRNPRLVAAIGTIEREKARLAAADAYRQRPVEPRFKAKAESIDYSPICPQCDGRRVFGEEPCPMCLGSGQMPGE